MKNKFIKSIVALSLFASIGITFANSNVNAKGDTFLNNIIALNSASADAGGEIKCELPPKKPTVCHEDKVGDVVVATYWGKKVE